MSFYDDNYCKNKKNYHEIILSWRIGISMPPRKRNQRKHKVLEYVDIKDMRHQNIQ